MWSACRGWGAARAALEEAAGAALARVAVAADGDQWAFHAGDGAKLRQPPSSRAIPAKIVVYWPDLFVMLLPLS